MAVVLAAWIGGVGYSCHISVHTARASNRPLCAAIWVTVLRKNHTGRHVHSSRDVSVLRHYGADAGVVPLGFTHRRVRPGGGRTFVPL